MVFTEANKELGTRDKSQDSEKVKTGVHGGRNHSVGKLTGWWTVAGLLSGPGFRFNFLFSRFLPQLPLPSSITSSPQWSLAQEDNEGR